MCRALEAFVGDLHGAEVWSGSLLSAGLDRTGTDAAWAIPDADCPRLCRAVAARTGQAPEELAADLGCWLVSHPTTAPIRRLLRFGGHDFAGFLMSLEDLPGRVALAVPRLRLPAMDVRFGEDDGILIDVEGGLAFFAALVEGLVRAMADDYGALVSVERDQADPEGPARLAVRLHDAGFAEARRFELVGARR